MRALLSPGVERAGSYVVLELHLKPEGSRLPVSPPVYLLACGTMLVFLSSGLNGDPANARVWVLAGFREEMPDDTGRRQFNLDSGHIS